MYGGGQCVRAADASACSKNASVLRRIVGCDGRLKQVVARIQRESELRMAHVLNIGQLDDGTYNFLVDCTSGHSGPILGLWSTWPLSGGIGTPL